MSATQKVMCRSRAEVGSIRQPSILYYLLAWVGSAVSLDETWSLQLQEKGDMGVCQSRAYRNIIMLSIGVRWVMFASFVKGFGTNIVLRIISLGDSVIALSHNFTERLQTSMCNIYPSPLWRLYSVNFWNSDQYMLDLGFHLGFNFTYLIRDMEGDHFCKQANWCFKVVTFGFSMSTD